MARLHARHTLIGGQFTRLQNSRRDRLTLRGGWRGPRQRARAKTGRLGETLLSPYSLLKTEATETAVCVHLLALTRSSMAWH